MSRRLGSRSTTRSRRSGARSPRFEGSVAIAAQRGRRARPTLLLALRGSGQALYVGLADDAYIVASEPYGLVEETPGYLRMDGETPADRATRRAAGARSSCSTATRAGHARGHPALAYDGTRAAGRPAELRPAEITTRDIDRGDYPHFLLKEISEAPASFRKTLRGKLVDARRPLVVPSAPETLPADLRRRLARRRRSTGSSPSARAPPPSPPRALAPRSTRRSRAPTSRVEADAGHRAVGLRAARPT